MTAMLGGSLGYNIAEKFHLEATGRGLSDIYIHKYDWACRSSHCEITEVDFGQVAPTKLAKPVREMT